MYNISRGSTSFPVDEIKDNQLKLTNASRGFPTQLNWQNRSEPTGLELKRRKLRDNSKIQAEGIV